MNYIPPAVVCKIASADVILHEKPDQLSARLTDALVIDARALK